MASLIKKQGTANAFPKLVITQLGTVVTHAVQNILRQIQTWTNNLASPAPVAGQVLTAVAPSPHSLQEVLGGPIAKWASSSSSNAHLNFFLRLFGTNYPIPAMSIPAVGGSNQGTLYGTVFVSPAFVGMNALGNNGLFVVPATYPKPTFLVTGHGHASALTLANPTSQAQLIIDLTPLTISALNTAYVWHATQVTCTPTTTANLTITKITGTPAPYYWALTSNYAHPLITFYLTFRVQV